MRALGLGLALVLAACPGSGGDGQHALAAMIEVKLEMRAAIEELKRASSALDEARAEIDRARGDLDRSRRALDKALERPAASPSAADDLDALLRSPGALDPELAAGITCAEEGACTIKRSVVDALAGDPASFSRQARIVPPFRDGQTGFKLYGIRPGSLFKLIGMKNGDTISAINGKPMRTVDDLMGLFTGLRKAKKLDLVGERRGEPLSITVTIADDEAPPRR